MQRHLCCTQSNSCSRRYPHTLLCFIPCPSLSPSAVMHVNTVRQTLILGTDQLFTMPLSLPGGIRKEDVVHSHRMPITAMGYSKCFGLIITACEGSVKLLILLCLGGRSHEAYSSSFVCLFVIPSVSSVLRRTLNDEP